MRYTITTILFAVISAQGLFGQISINEFMASNTLTVTDANGDFDDWMELHNSGGTAVDVAGYFLTDDPLDLQKFQIPTGSATLTTIPAGGFLLVWCDDETLQGPLHTNFKLGAGGEFIGLSNANNTVLDSMTFGVQVSDVSYGRLADGGPTWNLFTTPTPGSTNAPVSVASTLNDDTRIFPNPSSGSFRSSNGNAFAVYSMVGTKVLVSDPQGQADGSLLPSGIYLVLFTDGQRTSIVKY